MKHQNAKHFTAFQKYNSFVDKCSPDFISKLVTL